MIIWHFWWLLLENVNLLVFSEKSHYKFFLISVPLIYMDAANDDQIGGADIIYQKEIIKKIPGKAGCLEKFTVEKFVHCIRKTMKISLENANVSCKVPALHFTDYNSSHLDYCPTREEALGRGLISECLFCNCAFCKISIFLRTYDKALMSHKYLLK